jgi:hypothetical protein
MSDSNWNYTAAEKKAIGAAWDEIAYLMDATGHSEPHRLRDALKTERRVRSCITAAKALIVNGFAEGMKSNPPASTLAGYSEGVSIGVILGADHRLRRSGAVGRHDPTPTDRERLPRLLDAAREAHDSYIARGLNSLQAPPRRMSPRV